ncbi:polynucleotide kinase-phosphatase [Bacillus rubiinfantis]|uniref:polynucleotide kinase-phosphatase n=1 Tax=Bacillus rubiinfantis TaxID=1499680 RepID=UPI0005A5D9F0|nr:polynucleotide kinase-phosphatase [Bacillus rubiinfantis]
MVIQLPFSGIILLVGPSNSGKTSLLHRLIEQGHLKESEVISSDQFRILVSDEEFISWHNSPRDEADILYDEYKRISAAAFEAMDFLLGNRCRLNKLTLIDATHLKNEERERYLQLGKKYHIPVSAIVLDIGENECIRRDKDRDFPRGKNRIRQQYQQFRQTLRSIKKEGFHRVYVFKKEELDEIKIVRHGNPVVIEVGNGIDFIGDIHGCFTEFIELLAKLGYQENEQGFYLHPNGRKFLSLGDIMSRGPHSLKTMQFFKKHLDAGYAYMIDSNHGWKIARWLDGRNVKLAHGDEKVEAEFEEYERINGKEATDQLKTELREMLVAVKSHLVIQKHGVNVAVAVHAGIKDHYLGKQSQRIADYCRYGDSDGVDENGKPIRRDWTVNHHSSELIIWGHDPKPQPLLVNNTINIDQGVVFGGNLTAYRFPEKQFVSVTAKQDYANVPDNPLLVWEQQRLAPPSIGKLLNGYSVITDHYGQVDIPRDGILSALDDLSHFTLPLEEVVYLPPTMSPTPNPAKLKDYLEHPAEAFEYYQSHGVETMVVEKKHMGSRGIVLLFKDEETAETYIGRKTLGVIYTRTGRAFFQQELQKQIIHQLNRDLVKNGYFIKHNTDFVLLDAEILPWNLKAKELILRQYAHVGEMAYLGRSQVQRQLKYALDNGKPVDEWLLEAEKLLENAKIFNEVYQKYCWETDGLNGIQIAPFHTLAHSTETHFDKPHTWHMENNKHLSEMSSLFVKTEYRVVHDEESKKAAIKWWEEMTEDGHEGFVVKPEQFVSRYKGKLVQPAIKVRGRKYLHIIYGMDYLHQENLSRLKQRNTGKKQRNALKEFSLGIEAVNRFVRKESLERWHECVLAVLAVEAETIDPRL